MAQFDVVFEKLNQVILEDEQQRITIDTSAAVRELDEIDELRRFSAEIQEPDPLSFTTT